MRKALQDKTVTIQLPQLVTVILSLIGGVAQVINYLVVPASSQLHAGIAIGLYFLIASGIPPLTGAAFRAALHLPSWLNYLINAALGAALLALGTLHTSSVIHLVLATVITVASALGFNSRVQPVPGVVGPMAATPPVAKPAV